MASRSRLAEASNGNRTKNLNASVARFSFASLCCNLNMRVASGGQNCSIKKGWVCEAVAQPISQLGPSAFGERGSMSGLPESGHGRVIISTRPPQPVGVILRNSGAGRQKILETDPGPISTYPPFLMSDRLFRIEKIAAFGG